MKILVIGATGMPGKPVAAQFIKVKREHLDWIRKTSNYLAEYTANL